MAKRKKARKSTTTTKRRTTPRRRKAAAATNPPPPRRRRASTKRAKPRARRNPPARFLGIVKKRARRNPPSALAQFAKDAALVVAGGAASVAVTGILQRLVDDPGADGAISVLTPAVLAGVAVQFGGKSGRHLGSGALGVMGAAVVSAVSKTLALRSPDNSGTNPPDPLPYDLSGGNPFALGY